MTFFVFEENVLHQYIYLKISGNKSIILVVYVVNTLLTINDIELFHETKKTLSKTSEMKDSHEASFMLGILIHGDRSRGMLRLS